MNTMKATTVKPISDCTIQYTIAYVDTRGLSDEQIKELDAWSKYGPETHGDAKREPESHPYCWFPNQKNFAARLDRASPAWGEEEIEEWVTDLEGVAIAAASDDGVVASDLRAFFIRLSYVECSFTDRTGDKIIHRYSVPRVWDCKTDYFGKFFTFVKRAGDGKFVEYETFKSTY